MIPQNMMTIKWPICRWRRTVSKKRLSQCPRTPPVPADERPGEALNAGKLFSVGHALELYLKAVNTKMFGHNVTQIWHDCKLNDAAFLPRFELRETVLSHDLFNPKDYENGYENW